MEKAAPFSLEGTITRIGDVNTRSATFRQHEGHEHDQIFTAFIAGIVRVVAGIHEDAARRIHFTGARRIVAMINRQVARYECCPKRTTMFMTIPVSVLNFDGTSSGSVPEASSSPVTPDPGVARTGIAVLNSTMAASATTISSFGFHDNFADISTSIE